MGILKIFTSFCCVTNGNTATKQNVRSVMASGTTACINTLCTLVYRKTPSGLSRRTADLPSSNGKSNTSVCWENYSGGLSLTDSMFIPHKHMLKNNPCRNINIHVHDHRVLQQDLRSSEELPENDRQTSNDTNNAVTEIFFIYFSS